MLHGEPSFAQRIGRQIYQRLTREPPKSEDFSLKELWAIFFSFHVNALPKRTPLKTSLHNQQVFLEKWEDSDFEEKAP